MDDWFESDGQREFRQIFQGMGQINEVLRDLNKKVDEVRNVQLSRSSAALEARKGQKYRQTFI